MLLSEEQHKALFPWDTTKSRANGSFFFFFSDLRFQIHVAKKERKWPSQTIQFNSSKQTSHLVPT